MEGEGFLEERERRRPIGGGINFYNYFFLLFSATISRVLLGEFYFFSKYISSAEVVVCYGGLRFSEFRCDILVKKSRKEGRKKIKKENQRRYLLCSEGGAGPIYLGQHRAAVLVFTLEPILIFPSNSKEKISAIDSSSAGLCFFLSSSRSSLSTSPFRLYLS